MSENLSQRGDTYLAKLNSENIPAWARGMSMILTGLVGFILALGLNLGDIVNRYMDSRSQIETTTLSQHGQLEVSALTGLIDSNKGLTQHVADLILSINTLIEENKKLSEKNSDLLIENAQLNQSVVANLGIINKLNADVQDLKTRLELKE